MALSDVVNTFGQHLLRIYGERVHKVAIDAGFTCPNRDGSKGIGGCTFCNNHSFSPHGRQPDPVTTQIDNGRAVIARRTGARKFLAYFQSYTNTYDGIAQLKTRYDNALSHESVIGLSIGTRPDCVTTGVLDLLAQYRDTGHEVWLELGVQSSFDETLRRVNRGHQFKEYVTTLKAARQRGLPVCAHLILGLPGEEPRHAYTTLRRILDNGVDGLKLHPLHVVKGTLLANEWRRGEYFPLTMEQYITIVADLVEQTPPEIIYHRLTGTASLDILLTPHWCHWKWRVLNGIEQELVRRGTRQGFGGNK